MTIDTGQGPVSSQVIARIVLRGGLSETSRLSKWVESLAARYCINDEIEFGIHLCLEEAVSNVIRHGYTSGTAEPVTAEFTPPDEGERFESVCKPLVYTAM